MNEEQIERRMYSKEEIESIIETYIKNNLQIEVWCNGHSIEVTLKDSFNTVSRSESYIDDYLGL